MRTKMIDKKDKLQEIMGLFQDMFDEQISEMAEVRENNIKYANGKHDKNMSDMNALMEKARIKYADDSIVDDFRREFKGALDKHREALDVINGKYKNLDSVKSIIADLEKDIKEVKKIGGDLKINIEEHDQNLLLRISRMELDLSAMKRGMTENNEFIKGLLSKK